MFSRIFVTAVLEINRFLRTADLEVRRRYYPNWYRWKSTKPLYISVLVSALYLRTQWRNGEMNPTGHARATVVCGDGVVKWILETKEELKLRSGKRFPGTETSKVLATGLKSRTLILQRQLFPHLEMIRVKLPAQRFPWNRYRRPSLPFVLKGKLLSVWWITTRWGSKTWI